MTQDSNIAPSFDRMRNMLVRAAEIRESEQQQIFDALDDIYARLSPVESLGAVRKRLSELPDRTEMSVLAERLDEAMSRLEAQDNAIASVARAVDSIVDKLAKPFAELGGRLEGVAGRFEGVAGRMDGLEDKLQNIHRRLDELDVHLDKQDSRLENLPSAVHGPVRERIDTAESALRERVEATEISLRDQVETAESTLRERIDAVDAGTRKRVDELDSSTKQQITSTTESLREEVREAAQLLDSSDRIESISDKLGQLDSRIDETTKWLSKVEEGIASRVGDLDGMIKARLSTVEGVITKRPDTDSLNSLVRKSNEESERRIGGQLDEAMATFAELMLGGGPPQQQIIQTTPPPRQPRRATRNGNTRPRNGSKKDEPAEETADA